MINLVTKWFDETQSEVLHRNKEQEDFTAAELRSEARKRGYVLLETKNHYIVVRDGSTPDDIKVSARRKKMTEILSEISNRLVARMFNDK